MEFFSGSAADMLKKYGQAVPEQQPLSSLEEAQAAKAKLEAEKEPEAHFHDGHACTADHSSEHSHDKAHEHAHDGDHGHKEAPHAHEHGHKKSACSEDHSHDGHAHAGGHEEEHAAAKDFLRAQISKYEASQKGKPDHDHECSHDHDHECSHAHDGHEHSHDHDEHPVATALKAGLDASRVEVQAEGSGCGQKLQILVVAKDFEGLTMIKQHRLVNTVAKDELAKVHAFHVKTYTPAKWAARRK